jgi:hypothetical protein
MNAAALDLQSWSRSKFHLAEVRQPVLERAHDVAIAHVGHQQSGVLLVEHSVLSGGAAVLTGQSWSGFKPDLV